MCKQCNGYLRELKIGFDMTTYAVTICTRCKHWCSNLIPTKQHPERGTPSPEEMRRTVKGWR